MINRGSRGQECSARVVRATVQSGRLLFVGVQKSFMYSGSVE